MVGKTQYSYLNASLFLSLRVYILLNSSLSLSLLLNAVRQKVQQFLNAACTGNLDLLKSKLISFIFICLCVRVYKWICVTFDCFIWVQFCYLCVYQ